MKKSFLLVLLVSFFVSFLSAQENAAKPSSWGTPEEAQKLSKEIQERFKGMTNRYLGSEGNQKASQFIEEEFKRLSNGNSSYLLYRQPYVDYGEVYIQLEGDIKIPVYSLEANFINTSNFAENEFESKLVYVGSGTLPELDGKKLKGNIALMNFKSEDNWQYLPPLGAKGVIFLEDKHLSSYESDEKVSGAPLTFPRYFLKKEELSKLETIMGEDYAKSAPIKVNQSKINKWVNGFDHKIHWAYVPGKNEEKVMVIAAKYDTNGVIPQLSVNSSNDVNLAMLLNLLEVFSKNQPNISVLFVAYNSYYSGLLGLDEFFWYATVPDSFIDNEKKIYENRRVFYSTINQFYSEYSRDKIEQMRYGIEEINKINYPWKKAMVDRLRAKQNGASEKILNYSHQVKKLDEFFNEIFSGKSSFKSDNPLCTNVLQFFKAGGEITALKDATQIDLIKEDKVGYDLVLELKETEKEIFKLTRNFQKKNDVQGNLDSLFKQKQEQLAKLKGSLERRDSIWKKLQNALENATVEIDVSLLELINKMHELVSFEYKLYGFKGEKEDSITIQKLFNSSFAEQLFIQEKAGEERSLLPSHFEGDLKNYFSEISDQTAKYVKGAELELNIISQNQKLRNLLLNKDKSGHKLVLFLDLEFTFGNNKFGMFPNLFMNMKAIPGILFGRGSKGEFINAVKFVENSVLMTVNLMDQYKNNVNCLINTTTTNNFNLFLFRDIAPSTAAAQTAGVPALALVTTEDSYLYENTPLNDFTQISEQNLIDLWRYVENYLPMLVKDSSYINTTLKPYDESYSSYVFNFVQQDNLSISVPETPVEDVLFTFSQQSNTPAAGKGERLLSRRGYMDYKILMSNELGTVSVHQVRKFRTYGYEAFQYDKTGQKIINALDMRKGAKVFTVDLLAVQDNFKEYTLPVFNCEKVDLYGVYDFSEMERYGSVEVLDGIQNSIPDNYSISGMPVTGSYPWIRVPRVKGGFSLFVKPDLPVKLIFQNKVLINAKGSEKSTALGLGYKPSELDRSAIYWNSFKDVYRLNDYRIKLLSSKGVNDGLVNVIHEKSAGYLDEAKKELAEGKVSSFFQKVYNGYGMAYAAYPKILKVMNDMIKAVVFYLALVIPFSFFIQRLCFPVTKIEKQLGMNVLVFFATFMIFRYVHPAFELTDAPLIILIAFIQIVLALFVFKVLYNKFDSRIKALQGKTTGDATGANIVSQALVIGVNNMRKRKIRTLLTCITIVLVTFTMLSFTSISSTVDPTMIKKDYEPPYTGVMYSKNTWTTIEPDYFLQSFPNRVSTVKRSWFNKKALNTLTPIELKKENHDHIYQLEKLVGLEVGEKDFLGDLPITGSFFSSNDANEIILSTGMGKILGLDIENFSPVKINMLGEEYTLVGLFDDKKIEEFYDQRGVSILPQEQLGKPMSDSELEEMNDSEDESNASYRSMNSLVIGILPYDKLKIIGGTCISVSIKYDDPQKMWKDVSTFSIFSKENIYVGTTKEFKVEGRNQKIKKGSYFMGSGFSTAIGGLTDLIIPLIISATIIMNTMLGTVYERKKEIEIYTAVGLNPSQIGFFFIAESLVYGIIGSVAGYLFGQGVTKIIDQFDLLNIDLNFSSLLVVYVMILTIVIVVASTIYPAFMAVKEAQPSGESLAKAEGEKKDGSLEVLFPFSYTEVRRFAINAFLREYILKFSDASTGSFMSQSLGYRIGDHYDSATDFTTTESLIQKFNIALTPYDLGVTEEIELVTFYHPKVNAYMVKMVVKRISGTDSNWVRTNKPFADELRKLMLGWRVEPASVQDRCQIEGEDLFGALNQQKKEEEGNELNG